MSSNTSTTTGQEETTLYESVFGEEMVRDYPDETLPPQTCADQMHETMTNYWNMLVAMMFLVLFMVWVPYLFLCCRKQYRFLAWIHYIVGLIKIVCGILLATALLPNCPLDCGAFFCSLREYSPGPEYGCMVAIVGFFWILKGCFLTISGNRAKAARAKAKADAADAKGATAHSFGAAPAGTGYVDDEAEPNIAEIL